MTALGHELLKGDTTNIRLPRPHVRPWIAVVGSVAWGATLLRFALMALGN